MKPSQVSPEVEDPVKGRILGYARERFFAVGFRSITMEEIATSLGLSKKTLYVHFATKNELVEAVLMAKAGRVRACLDKILAESTPVEEKMATVLEAIQEETAEVKAPFLHDLRRYAPEVFEHFRTFRAATIPGYFSRIMEEGQRAGRVRKDLKPALILTLLMSSIEGILNPDSLLRLKSTPREGIETILKIVFEGILIRPDSLT